MDPKNPLVAQREGGSSSSGEGEEGEDGSEEGEDESADDGGSELQRVSGSEASEGRGEGGSGSEGEGESSGGEGEEGDEGEDLDAEGGADPEQAEKLARLQQKLEEGLRQKQEAGGGAKAQQQQQQQQDAGQRQAGKEGGKQQQQGMSKEEQQRQRALASGALELQGPQDLPYTIKLPDSYPKFAALVRAWTLVFGSCTAVHTDMHACTRLHTPRAHACTNGRMHACLCSPVMHAEWNADWLQVLKCCGQRKWHHCVTWAALQVPLG